MAAIPAINPIVSLTSLDSTNQVNRLEDSLFTGTSTVQNSTPQTGTFAQFLDEALQQVNTLQKNGEAASIGLATGQIQDVHTAMIAMEKANLSLSLTVEVRNKILDAYSEIMRMTI